MKVRDAIDAFAASQTETSPSAVTGEAVAVSSATKRIAYAYERFRNTLEPDEEDILRRKAIWRILERRLEDDRAPRASAVAMLQELIRARYISSANSAHVERVAQHVGRTASIWQRLAPPLRDWWLHIAAVAIDRELYPRHQEEALVQLMYEDTRVRTVWTDRLVAENDRDTQLYVACHRVLFAADDFEITYHYFLHYFPAWRQEPAASAAVVALAHDLPVFYRQMQLSLRHPARERLVRLLRPEAVLYRTVRGVVTEQPASAHESEAALEAATREVLTARQQAIRTRIGRRAWHSILFLFFTKTLLAFFIEVPYELVVLGKVHVAPLLVNSVFHPLLLLVLATSARLPGQRNSDKVVEGVRRIMTGEGELPTVVVSSAQRYGALTWSLFALVYSVLFVAVFWGLFTVLDLAGFSLPAMGFFVVFLGLVSFLSIRIRRSTDDVRVLPRREGATAAVFNFLTLPVLEFGRLLTYNISQVNVALFFMDRVLEAPFKLLIDIIEEWFAFVRDRRDEIV